MSQLAEFDLSLPSSLALSAGPLRSALQHFAHLRELHQLYAQAQHLTGLEFVAAILDKLAICVQYNTAELRRLPTAGAFVALANHPCGLLDGLVLLHVLGQARPDLRVAVNELLAPLLPQLGAQFVLVQPDAPTPGRNVPGLRRLLRFLHNDIPLLLFPAGEVAHRPGLFQGVTESVWHPTAGRLLTATRLPVVPVWISGQNSTSFSWLGLLHSFLRTARLPAELLNKRGTSVQVRIGTAVAAAELCGLSAAERLTYLRARVHALSGGTPRNDPGVHPPLAPPVIAETTPVLVEADLAALRPGRLLLQHHRWEVYVAKSKEIPNVLREISRLRELTFRGEGEGTQQPCDLDAYDAYYRHLFLYDRQQRCVVGAYRLGHGRSILRQHGRRGFYLHSLFKMKRALCPLLRQSLELGRSFVRAEYQRQPLPLTLLWKGIALYLSAHPEYRYLIGPVSISSRFQPLSKAVMIDFIRRHCFDAEMAAYVRPRKQFRYRPLDKQEPAAVLQTGLDDVQALNKLVASLEPGGMGVPVLLRHYMQQNARFVGFNLDPAFTNALDGFIILDAYDLPERTRRLLNRY
ncbi:lysophospholipid acyltransferase family protein [Hymenobacter sp. GOD-10R]|uniref:lysophospholipid acyltransferase family protein n=1 Tax=Hymenobacter sp. GOD-10R TaxID=3093922 RepID=UPI002D772CEF|nr:GNAT family N-acyltransferase [Hymenobacter sp. GOD-10R]WRQ31176.1 GNAT family N-acyltransferase [Hymenobacter sp. GOD-10R]